MRTSPARRSTTRSTSAPRPTAPLRVAALTSAVVAATVLAGCADAEPTGGGDLPGTAVPLATPETLPRGGEESVGPEDQGAPACVDWISFESPREAAAGAGAVLLGTVVEQAGTVQLYGVDANRWTVDVERVLERPEPLQDGAEPPPELPVAAGDRIAVVSTPETCAEGGAYPEGDPLDPATGLGDADGTIVVFLSGAWEDGGDVREPSLITPYQGVVTPTADGELPTEWPTP